MGLAGLKNKKMNSIKFSVTITFRGEDVKPEEEKAIAQNIANALVNHITGGEGIAPEETDYLTDHILIQSNNAELSVCVDDALA